MKMNKNFAITAAAILFFIFGFLVFSGFIIGKEFSESTRSAEDVVVEQLQAENDYCREYFHYITNYETSSVWVAIREANPNLEPFIIEEYTNIIIKNSKKYNFDPLFVVSLIYRESSFNCLAESSAKCIGLMQVNPAAHQEKLDKRNLERHEVFYVEHNVDIGCEILREYFDAEGSIKGALKRYLGEHNNNYYMDILEMYANLRANSYPFYTGEINATMD